MYRDMEKDDEIHMLREEILQLRRQLEEATKKLQQSQEWLVAPWGREQADDVLQYEMGWEGRKLTDKEWKRLHMEVPDCIGLCDMVEDNYKSQLAICIEDILDIPNKYEQSS